MARTRDPRLVQIDQMFTPSALEADAQKALAELKKAFHALALKVYKSVPAESREKSLALTSLQSASFYASHALSHPPVEAEVASKAESKPAAAKPAKAAKSGGVKTTSAGKIDLRTKEGRALKAAQDATAPGAVTGPGEDEDTDANVVAIGERRSRRL